MYPAGLSSSERASILRYQKAVDNKLERPEHFETSHLTRHVGSSLSVSHSVQILLRVCSLVRRSLPHAAGRGGGTEAAEEVEEEE